LAGIPWLHSLCGRVIDRAARDGELPVQVVDNHETARSNSKLLRQLGLNDNFQELAVDLADPLGKWRKDSATRFERNEDRELAIDNLDGTLQRNSFSQCSSKRERHQE
jgi:hypothetical protein